ncbi:unnamed protein product [Musa acuminata var. zebrina]
MRVIGLAVQGAKHTELKAQKMFRGLPGLRQTLAAARRVSGSVNCHEVLRIHRSTDLRKIREQFRKMSILTHPHKNPSAAANGAFKLVMEAWTRQSSRGNAQNGDEDHSADSNSNQMGRNTKPTADISQGEDDDGDTICLTCRNDSCGFLDKDRTVNKCECCELIILLAKDLNLRIEGSGSVSFIWEKLEIGVKNADTIAIEGGSTINVNP